MEKLLDELKKLRIEIKNYAVASEKKQKEMINYLAFQVQIQKQILNKLVKLTKEENGDN